MKCDWCRKTIGAYEVTGESALYSPDRVYILCEPCFLKEDALIEKEGTNDLPIVLANYKRRVCSYVRK